MNTKNEKVEQTASMLVAVVTQLRADGAPEPIQLAYLKTVMVDQEQVHTRDRQPVLQLVNNQLGTKWSFNQIKKAEEFHNEPAPIKVQELNGTAQVSVSGQPAEASFAKESQAGEHLHQEPVTQSTTTAPDHNGQTSSNANEQDTNNMNAQTNNTADLNLAEAVKAFELVMTAIGRITVEQRHEGWTSFLGTSPDLLPSGLPSLPLLTRPSRSTRTSCSSPTQWKKQQAKKLYKTSCAGVQLTSQKNPATTKTSPASA